MDYNGDREMYNTMFKFQNGGRRVLTEGSFVIFHETENHQFDPRGQRGFVEKIDKDSEEVNISTFDGKIIKNISIHRVFL